jgi:hypothetical protein
MKVGLRSSCLTILEDFKQVTQEPELHRASLYPDQLAESTISALRLFLSSSKLSSRYIERGEDCEGCNHTSLPPVPPKRIPRLDGMFSNLNESMDNSSFSLLSGLNESEPTKANKKQCGAITSVNQSARILIMYTKPRSEIFHQEML